MPTYIVTDKQTGRKLRLTGDSPPTEQELQQIFANQPTRSPAESRSRIAALEAEQAALQDEPGMLRSVVGGTISDLRGIPEAVTEMVTGGLATTAGGLAGAGTAIASQAMHQNDPMGAGADVLEAVQEAGTFQPRTEPGRRASAALMAPFETFEQLADRIGEGTGEGDDVLGATALKTAILGAPALFGVRRGTVNRRPPETTRRRDIARNASEEGYVTPPSVRGEASLAEGIGGKIKTGQRAIEINQAVTDNLAARAVGLPEGTPLSVDALQAIRLEAGKAYNAIRNAGQIVTDTAFRRDIANATQRFRTAAKDFPALAEKQVIDLIDSLRVDAFDAASGIDAMSVLRGRADVAFKQGDTQLGRSYKAASDAIESVIDRHLGRGQSTQLLDDFRQARRQIAETYSVEEALRAGNMEAGNVNAANLSAQLKKGTPLTGDLRTIAQFANTFPSVSRLFTGTPQAFSPLDLAALGIGGSAAGGAAALGAGPAAFIPAMLGVTRPALRWSALRAPGLLAETVTPNPAAIAGAGASALLSEGQDENPDADN